MKRDIIPIEQALPGQILLIPTFGKPVFPGTFMPIAFARAEEIELVEKAVTEEKLIGVVLVRQEGSKSESLYSVGTAARIVKKIVQPDHSITVFILAIKRFKIEKILNHETPIIAEVSYLDDIISGDKRELQALTRQLITEMKRLSDNSPLASEEFRINMNSIDAPGKLADFIAASLNLDRKQQQEILEELDLRKRSEQVLIYVKKEQELLEIQKRVSSQINERIEKSQREYFLREEIKAIKRELGEPADAKSSDYHKFKVVIDKLPLSESVREQVEQELEKFNMMEPGASEFIVTRSYLETIIALPWHIAPLEKIDMQRAEKILERDHYGLLDVKERILEYLAVRKLKSNNRGTIICLVGPPGVGKTSVGRSIAKTLGRPFFRFSVGGMRDEAEIKGHRRTYVGAMPGKIIQGLKITKSEAPVFMIDEIDKMGSSFQGDPSSALLEVLDPEQNTQFRDHYLDLPFDLSKVVFILTANSLDPIPRPLLDRMEVIRLAGYITQEKIEIATRYLIPRSLERHGLPKNGVRYKAEVLNQLIDGYARESGLRNLEKMLDRIHRKLARASLSGSVTLPKRIQPPDLEIYLKKPVFAADFSVGPEHPGVVNGLAWTSLGGELLIIEAIAIPGKEGLQLTGQMGDIMKESANIALSLVRSIYLPSPAAEGEELSSYKTNENFFSKHTLHVHIPEGATPKDGPSAGITMAAALLSLVCQQRVRSGFAMTGELSLTGRVLPIGGLKEKVIAAKRSNIKDIIIPEQNRRDLDEVPEHIRAGICFHPVKSFTQVIQLLLPEISYRSNVLPN